MLQTAISGLLKFCNDENDFDDDKYERAKHLQECAKNGNLEELEKCLAAKSYKNVVNFKNHLSCTPLRLAASEGHTECVKCLLLNGADVDIPDVKAQTPLLSALKGNHLQCAHELLNHGANPNGNLMHMTAPLYFVAMQGCYNGMKLLLDSGADVDGVKRDVEYTFSSPPLQVALIYKFYDCFKLLIQYGADPNYVKNTQPTTQSILLYQCAIKYKCDFKFFELLYEVGSNIYAKDENQRYTWMAEKRTDIYQYLKTISENPRSLKSSCRLCIRKIIGKQRLKDIEHLNIPLFLKQYLNFKDME